MFEFFENSFHKQTMTKDTREELLDAALSVFAKKGFDGSTVKDIADAAKQNVSSISYYFDGKDGLYKACLERFGHARLQIAESILTSPESAEDFRVKFKLFINQIFEAHFKEEDAGNIIFRDLDCGRAETLAVFKQVMMKIFTAVENFVREGQKTKIIVANCNPTHLAILLLAPVIHLMKSDHVGYALHGLTLKNQDYRKEMIDLMMNVYLKGILRNPS